MPIVVGFVVIDDLGHGLEELGDLGAARRFVHVLMTNTAVLVWNRKQKIIEIRKMAYLKTSHLIVKRNDVTFKKRFLGSVKIDVKVLPNLILINFKVIFSK